MQLLPKNRREIYSGWEFNSQSWHETTRRGLNILPDTGSVWFLNILDSPGNQYFHFHPGPCHLAIV